MGGRKAEEFLSFFFFLSTSDITDRWEESVQLIYSLAPEVWGQAWRREASVWLVLMAWRCVCVVGSVRGDQDASSVKASGLNACRLRRVRSLVLVNGLDVLWGEAAHASVATTPPA